MPDNTKVADMTREQRLQHKAVLKVALQNLHTVIDSIQTLDHAMYDEILDCFDSAQELIEQKQLLLTKVDS